MPCNARISMPVHASSCISVVFAAHLFFLRICLAAWALSAPKCLPAFRAKQFSAVLPSLHLFHLCSILSIHKFCMFSSHLVRFCAWARSLLCFWLLVLGQLSHGGLEQSLQHVDSPIPAPRAYLGTPAGTHRMAW